MSIVEIQDASYGLILIHQPTPHTVPRFLLVQHLGGEHWAFPKGHPEVGENIQATIRREIAEEMGITEYTVISEHLFVEAYRYTRGNRVINKTNTYFLARTAHDVVSLQKKELIAYHWASYQEALKTITYVESRELLTDAMNIIKTLRYIVKGS